MKRETLRKRKQLLNRISERNYKDLLQYVEEIYLSDYQIKILMARKFSNLESALLPLALEENGGRVQTLYQQKFPTPDSEPIVISNRALDMIETKIKSGKYKRILLTDDIIIHGRTLQIIAMQLAKWFEEAGITDYTIQIMAYAESDDGVIVSENSEGGKDFLKERSVKHVCTKSEWRAVSNRIVSILLLLGQPYTSYVPNSRIPKSSPLGERLKRAIDSENIFTPFQMSTDITAYDMKSYSYIENTEYPFALNCSIRIYDYGNLQQYIMVPMVMLKPITRDVLQRYFEELERVMPEQSFCAINSISNQTIKYQAVVYLTSAILGRYFIRNHLQFTEEFPVYDAHEEYMNFYCRLIDASKLQQSNLDFQQLSEKFDMLYEPCPIDDKELYREPGVEELNDIIDELYTEISTSNTAVTKDSMRALMGKFLNRNGELDENRCATLKHVGGCEENTAAPRLMGYPLINIHDKFQKFKREWALAVLYAIDFGKGSIVPKCLNNINGGIYFSVIHAGEQNYKYFANTYFPFLYGLYRLEQAASKTGAFNQLGRQKKDFVKQYRVFWENRGHFLFKDDMERLVKMDVTTDFGEVLDHIAWDYFADDDVNRAIQLSKEIAENTITS